MLQFRAALTGMLYESASAAGQVSEIILDGHVYVPKEDQWPLPDYCELCGKTFHIPMCEEQVHHVDSPARCAVCGMYVCWGCMANGGACCRECQAEALEKKQNAPNKRRKTKC